MGKAATTGRWTCETAEEGCGDIRSVRRVPSRRGPEHRKALERLADQIRKAAPGTEEVISYKIPTFKYRGKPLLYLAAHEKHCSVYPYTDRMMAECGDELAGRTSGKGTIRFTARDPLPARLVTKLVKIRITEIDEGHG